MLIKNVKRAIVGITLLSTFSTLYARVGDFGGGNGGDGFVLLGRSFSSVSNINLFLRLDESYNQFRYQPTKEFQLYSLDLADMGIAKNPSLNFPESQQNTKDTVCVREYGCYEILNTKTFNSLVYRKGIFGEELNASTEYPRKEFALTTELASLYERYSEYSEQSSRMRIDSVIANLRNCTISTSLTNCTNSIPYAETEIDKVSEMEVKAADLYMKEVKSFMPRVRNNLYSAETILSIGVVSKIEEIRKVNAKLARLIEKTLLKLDWVLLDSSLKEINDEGYITSEAILKTQLASRKFGVVKITKLGWSVSFEKEEETIHPMNVSNRVALIFHEVLYQVLEDQGRLDSEIARLATAYLFMPDTGNRYISKAADIVFSDRY